jgi:hypothetical protein
MRDALFFFACMIVVALVTAAITLRVMALVAR